MFYNVFLHRTSSPGAYVGQVRPGSLAAAAGLVAGDVIIEIAGHQIKGARDVERVLSQLKTGQPVSLTYLHQDRREQRTITP